MSSKIRATFKQKEAMTLWFYLTRNGEPYSIPANTEFAFYVKVRKGDSNYVIEKDNTAFSIVSQTEGVLSLPLTSTDLNVDAMEYVGELVSLLDDGSVIKSVDLTFVVLEAVSD